MYMEIKDKLKKKYKIYKKKKLKILLYQYKRILLDIKDYDLLR